jgi:hypothetical protein
MDDTAILSLFILSVFFILSTYSTINMHCKFDVSKGFLLLVMWFFTTSLSGPSCHKFYFSHSTIELNDQMQRMEWIVKIFYDDLELALEKRNGGDVSFFAQDQKELKPLVEAYLAQTTAIKYNNQTLTSSFIGYELQGELVICYSEFPMTSQAHTVEIKNAILVDVFEDQKNVMQVEYNATTQTLICNQQSNSVTVFF